MYNGLSGVNCIYDDGSVVSLDAGPCQEILDSGAELVDANVSETEITVTTPAPGPGLLPLALGLGTFLLLFGGFRVSKRR